MTSRIYWLHNATFAMRCIISGLIFLNLGESGAPSYWMTVAICGLIIILAALIRNAHLERERERLKSIEQHIAEMPLYDLIEAIDKREDIKQLIINEAEET